jgi:tetratricopeptide (TPR) repeat protein
MSAVQLVPDLELHAVSAGLVDEAERRLEERASELCDRSGCRCDGLRARILDWRSRCYQRRHDWAAANADIELGLELAQGDDRLTAALFFQASIVSERVGQWLLARCYGEQALTLHERCGDRLGVHKLLNTLGGIDFLLGEHERACECLKESFRIALELGNDVGAAYAMSSLAQVQLRSGSVEQAEQHARRALELLDGRVDHLAESGNA